MAPTWLNAQAAYLFGMAAEARIKGDAALAKLLTEGACRCLDRLADYERSRATNRVTSPAEGPELSIMLGNKGHDNGTRI